MDDATISAVVSEITPLLVQRAPGKIFQVGPRTLVIDFGLRGEGFLLLSVNPNAPRMYLIKRRVRDLEKQSIAPTQFALILKKELSRSSVTAITKLAHDRVVRFEFETAREIESRERRTLIAQLTGRSANLHLLDAQGRILSQIRKGIGTGQTISELYQPPPQSGSRSEGVGIPGAGETQTISERLDAHFITRAVAEAAELRLAAERARLRTEISRRKKLLKQLDHDLESHADAEQNKRIGDLLLANVSTAKRTGNRATLIDYFVDDASEIEVDVDESLTLPEEAARRFASYAKSKRARRRIAARIEQIHAELAHFEKQREQLESSPEQLLPPASTAIDGASRKASQKGKPARIPGVRRYLSTDGYEILVGRAARDNDNLTFKIAKPNDIWLHAADYPGSHVVIRNPTRKDVPHRTLIEAAQLAAHFSQASKDPKVDVHYTPRKFLSKPKGAGPGLVRMSRFKNITVAPKEDAPRAP